MKSTLVRISALALAAASVGGCAGVLAHKGAVIDSQLAGSLQPGIDNKASVEKLLGRPSFTGQWNANEWYYVSRDTKQVAFRNPRVRKQTVLLVKFDQAGNVASIQRSGKEYVAGLDPTSRRPRPLGRRRGSSRSFSAISGQSGARAFPARSS